MKTEIRLCIKRGICLLLVLAMLGGELPLFAVPAYAEGETEITEPSESIVEEIPDAEPAEDFIVEEIPDAEPAEDIPEVETPIVEPTENVVVDEVEGELDNENSTLPEGLTLQDILAYYEEHAEEYDPETAELRDWLAAGIGEISDELWAEFEAYISSLINPNANPTVPSGQYGSGSYRYNTNPDGYRLYTEYFSDTSKKVAGVSRKTVIKAYLKAGETAYFGSSMYDSWIVGSADNPQSVTKKYNEGERGQEDIVVVDPEKNETPYNVIKGGAGHIQNAVMEKYGPKLNPNAPKTGEDNNDTVGYTPLSFTAEKAGVYTFHFRSRAGENSKTITGNTISKKVKDDFAIANEGGFGVAAWDITIVGLKQGSTTECEVKTGRVWADYLALQDGGPDDKRRTDLDLFVLTHDGFTYEVNIEQMVAGGLIFFANNTGFTNRDRNPLTLYHSFYDAKVKGMELGNAGEIPQLKPGDSGYQDINIKFHSPELPDDVFLKTFKVFFDNPGSDLPPSIKAEKPTAPEIQNLHFIGIDRGISAFMQGGDFIFEVKGATSVTIRMDLKTAIDRLIASLRVKDTNNTITNEERTQLTDLLKYRNGDENGQKGSGIIEVSGPVDSNIDTFTSNTFKWHGNDTNGVAVPIGNYMEEGTSNSIKAECDLKMGEIHFPMLDVEGLYGGVKVTRLEDEGADKYNLYYNNSPLAFDMIETPASYKDGVNHRKGNIANNWISFSEDNTKSYHYDSNTEYFSPCSDEMQMITTLGLDGKHYPVDSSESIKMKYNASGSTGGGDNAGIDMWTYYKATTSSQYQFNLAFSVIAAAETGIIRGTVFYDADANGEYNTANNSGDYYLHSVTVRLMHKDGVPLTHKVTVPWIDDNGYFVLDDQGSTIQIEKEVTYSVRTTGNGVYAFTGVPFNGTNEKYYVQVMLTEAQTDLRQFFCTTSKYAENTGIRNALGVTSTTYNGCDGNMMDISTPTKPKYYRDHFGELVFDKPHEEADGYIPNAQFVTLTENNKEATFAPIGYVTMIPQEYRSDITVKKEWATGSNKLNGIVVELYAWDSTGTHKDHSAAHGDTTRTGWLIGKEDLSESNGWQFTWNNLDNRLQYYVVEFYRDYTTTVVNTNGVVENRLILIGSTMPSYAPIGDVAGAAAYPTYYDFHYLTHEYKNNTVYNNHYYTAIPIQTFGDGQVYPDATTERVRLTNDVANAMQFEMTYTLTRENKNKYTYTLTNRQTPDEQEYYTWYGHETKLPHFVSWTIPENSTGTLDRLDFPLQICTETTHDHKNEGHIIGLVISSMDAAGKDFVEGNSTDKFRFDDTDGHTGVYFTPDKDIYMTGTGTRTYKCEYVLRKDAYGNRDFNSPVPVQTKEIDTTMSDGTIKKIRVIQDMEGKDVYTCSDYVVYNWYMTIHVYDAKPDGAIIYDPQSTDPITLQTALAADDRLTWAMEQFVYEGEQGIDTDAVRYRCQDDPRTYGTLQSGWHILSDDATPRNDIFGNDIYRVSLYKNAVDPHMGTCADAIAFAYSPNGVLSSIDDIKQLNFQNTNQLTTNATSKITIGNSESGTLTVTTTLARADKTERDQDHLNFIQVTYTPKEENPGIDVFYYKITVFSETTRDNSTYALAPDMDPTNGVEMYAYFIMEPQESDAEFAGATLTVGNKTDINFYVAGIGENDTTLTDADMTAYSVAFSVAGRDEDSIVDEVEAVPVSYSLKKAGQHFKGHDVTYYGFTYENILPQEMAKTITAILYKEMQGTKVPIDYLTYSVQQYAETVLKDSTETKLRAMMVDMLNYGAAAQRYLDESVSADKLANRILDDTQKNLPNSVNQSYLSSSQYSLSQNDGPISIQSVTVSLGEGMSADLLVRFKVTQPGNYKIALYSEKSTENKENNLHYDGSQSDVTVDPNNLVKEIILNTPQSFTGERVYRVTIKDIPPFYWDHPYVLKLKGAEDADISTLTYGVGSYIYNKLPAELPSVIDSYTALLQSMYNFNQSAKYWYKEEGETLPNGNS